ncbi:MAG: hypothetical protein K2N71_07085, partial [Oscillospiraceae bacterium]|nr:hypothetical protein [Oscillospiraceae bacterium]
FMNISSSKSPYLLQIERSNKPKATFGNRFRVAINEEEAKQTTETAEEEEATKEYTEKDPNESYALPPEEEPRDEYCDNIKDAESEYFLEKYGEKFNDSDMSKLLDELDETKDGVDPLQAMEEMTGVSVNTNPAGSLSDEDIEYFRSKYGNGFTAENMKMSGYGLKGLVQDEYGNMIVHQGIYHYGNDLTKSFFNELFGKGIISRNDYIYASGGSISCPQLGTSINIMLRDDELEKQMEYVRQMLQPDFEEGETYTWDEYMQMRLDVIDKLRGRDDLDYSKGVLDNWQRSLEKTRAVLDRIFGEVTL